MWSDSYNYYRIQSDQFFTQKVETEFVTNIILQTDCFKQKNHQSFSNANNFPWVDLVLADTNDGNFATSNKEIQFVTLIAIVCSKGQDTDQAIYLKTFSEIAEALNWKLYLEDDENEDAEIKRD
jgi:hypothetical protein